MITILNKDIEGMVRSKFVGRAIQYTEFTFHQKEVVLVNVHLNEGHKHSKRLQEIKRIYDFIDSKQKDIVILAGDFNSDPSSEVYTFLIEKGFKSAVAEAEGSELKTWPSKGPETCIDYIWVKGDHVSIKSAKLLKHIKASDHYGIKAVLDIEN